MAIHKITTIYGAPPAFVERQWEAFRGDHMEDEDQLIGYGVTELEAITELFSREDESC